LDVCWHHRFQPLPLPQALSVFSLHTQHEKALRWFSEQPKETRKMGEQGRQRILTEWNYEVQFAPVLDILNREK
jgi:hypothetical protein